MLIRHSILFASVCALATLSCSGSDGDPGPQGPEGPPGDPSGNGDPSVSGVTPSSAFLGRTMDVALSGYATNWGENVQVDFGEGITVNSVIVASPTAVLANITVADDAAQGKRSVSVTQDAEAVMYKDAFDVASPIAVSTTGTVAQGSVFVVTVRNKDIEHPFDTTTSGDGLFTPISFDNVSAEVPAGVFADVQSVSAYSAELVLLVDVNATAGSIDLTVKSGPNGEDSFPLPAAIDLTARSAKALTSGMAEMENITNPLESKLFSFTPGGSGTKILEFVTTPASADADPQLALLPRSGSFADLIGLSTTQLTVSSTSDPFYLVYFDSADAGYSFTVTATETAAQTGNETEPNNTSATAQAVALPYVFDQAELSAETDADWLSFTAVAGDVGKSVHVVTVGGDDFTDAVVDVLAGNGVTSLGGPSSDDDYHEDFVSDPIPSAGTYFVKIYGSDAGYFENTETKYRAIIRLE